MTTKNQLLFSKKQKVDKSTSMGDEDNVGGMFGIPKNNKQGVNSQKKLVNEEGQQTENLVKHKDNIKGNQNKIEKLPNTYIENIPTKDNVIKLQKENIDYQKQLEELQKQIVKERDAFIKDIEKHDKIYKTKNTEVKKISNEFNEKIEKLKKYENDLVLKNKIKNKSKATTEEDIQKEILFIETQIKIHEVKAKLSKEEYEEFEKYYEVEVKKEDNLKIKLKNKKNKLSKLEEEIKDMREVLKEHNKCEENYKQNLEIYQFINKSYKNELNIAKQLTLLEISEKNNQLIDEVKDKQDNEKDNIDKANEDEKNILPKIQNLNFPKKGMAELEAKIIKKNKIGIKNSNSNIKPINIYKKISNEFNDNERYKKEANKCIRINLSNKNIKTEGNYLFNDYENNLLQKYIPSNMINSYKEKYNDILQQKIEIEKKYINENKDIIKEKIVANNKQDFNDLKVKELSQKQALLNLQYQKLKEKTSNMKKNIREIEKQIKKEEEKLKMRERDRERIEIYFKGKKGNKNKNNISNSNINNKDGKIINT